MFLCARCCQYLRRSVDIISESVMFVSRGEHYQNCHRVAAVLCTIHTHTHTHTHTHVCTFAYLFVLNLSLVQVQHSVYVFKVGSQTCRSSHCLVPLYLAVSI